MMNTTPQNAPPPANSNPATASTAMVIGTDSYRGALEPRGTGDAFEVAQMIASSGLFGIKSPAEALAKIMYGRNIGISAMQSLQSLHSIEGKIGIEASLMMAICLRASHICEYFEPVLAECDELKATFVTKRKGRPEQRLVYTIEDAEKMGVIDRGADPERKKKNNWNANRRSMLMARSKAMLARQVYPDLTHGMYSSEELYDSAGDPDEMVGDVLTADQAAASAAERVVVVQAARRDYATEAEALKKRIREGGTSRAAAAEVREAIAAWDGIEPYKGQVAEFYNQVREERRKAAAAVAPATSADKPGPMPEGNLFTDASEKKPTGDGNA